MKKTKRISLICGALLMVLGIGAAVGTRQAALGENATSGNQIFFALSLIVIVLGAVELLRACVTVQKKTSVQTLSMAALFAALCYIGFSFFKIDIPVGSEKTAFHLGNVFCVLSALFIGGFWGGMSGAVGMTIADLTTAYVTSAPKTFVLKLCIGLIAGLVAHKVFSISRDKEHRKVSLPVATVLSCSAGMAFNVVADPVVGYFYKMYVLGVPQKAATVWAKMGAVTTSVNAVVAVVVASVLYLALRPALKRSGLLPEI